MSIVATNETAELDSVRTSVSPWALMAVTCVLVGISGGVRFWRDLRFQSMDRESSVCPFSLKDLNRSLGTWQSDEKMDGKLAPEIARIAGSSDHIVRTYIDEKTGEQVTALVIYGLARSVFGHTPDICYPSSGFTAAGAPVDQQVEIPGMQTPVKFRRAFYTKSAIGAFVEVDYTFFHNGEWLPDVSDRWKSFRQHPGIFKVQLERHSSKLSSDHSPTESLFTRIVQDLGSRVSQIKPPSK
jgi:Protein of unknown function (DUF3485)